MSFKLCVFCGSSFGHDPAYRNGVLELGRGIADRGIGLVYGGSGIGLMGELARTVLERGGSVTGVIPEAIHAKVPPLEVTELHVVADMHGRKALMYELSDAFVALPGGIGTMDELFEIFTWSQLGLHRKPVALYDILGYYTRLLAFLDHAVGEGFLKKTHRESLLAASSPGELFSAFESFAPPGEDKWIAGPGGEPPPR